MNITIKAMSVDDAKALLQWRYEGEYSMYNIVVDDDEVDEEAIYFTDPENHFYGIYSGDEFVGHAVFEAEAQVPGGNYSLDALDVGVGMRPDWTNHGKGAEIIAHVLEFGHRIYNATTFRATIAAWNIRAQKATEKNGFAVTDRFTATTSGKEFIIMVRQD